jgi:mannose/fructose/N-acetylgalactosamine-specific phosphotransferase system component IID
MKRNPEGKVLDAERLQRISYIVGIYKALRILYGKDLGNRFVHLPNSNRMFNGSTPLEYMKKGGLLAMQDVRRLLDARRGGI